jgi:hypothetical protein
VAICIGVSVAAMLDRSAATHTVDVTFEGIILAVNLPTVISSLFISVSATWTGVV